MCEVEYFWCSVSTYTRYWSVRVRMRTLFPSSTVFILHKWTFSVHVVLLSCNTGPCERWLALLDLMWKWFAKRLSFVHIYSSKRPSGIDNDIPCTEGWFCFYTSFRKLLKLRAEQHLVFMAGTGTVLKCLLTGKLKGVGKRLRKPQFIIYYNIILYKCTSRDLQFRLWEPSWNINSCTCESI